MEAPRIALIGARRVRQGLGPFVAEHLSRLGARVCAFLASSAEGREAAGADLERRLGHRPSGYTDLAQLLERERPDAIAILSPRGTHGRYLEAALAAGTHVLCEKPLLEGPRAAQRVDSLARAFQAAGLLLAENCQWPHVLPAFEELHGPIARPSEFAMRLTPASRGAEMLSDALPHVLSLLQVLAPGSGAHFEDLAFSTRAVDAREVQIEGTYLCGGRRLGVRVELVSGRTTPREAWLAIDGRRARRRVREQDYALFLGEDPPQGSERREVPLPDPLAAHLAAFLGDLDSVRGGAPPPASDAIIERARLLEHLLDAYTLA